MSQSIARIGSFGKIGERDIREIILRSGDGSIEASVIELGAALRDLRVRRADGTVQRVVLGLNSAADYRDYSPHMGAIAGRFANRIRAGRFVLDGVGYQLPLNENGRTSLHGGGAAGFGKAVWSLLHADAVSATLGLHVPSDDNGYPGAMTVTCRYSLTLAARLCIEIWAVTDAPTIVNLCHHSYFNLDGGPDILAHRLMVDADLFTPVDADLVPLGTLQSVAATHLDFRVLRDLRGNGGGSRIGIDNTFMLRRDRCETSAVSGHALAHAATLVSDLSALQMECWTTEPALQVYDGSKLAVAVPGLGGVRYGNSAGIALEPQHVPNSPNLPQFPSTTLRPGELYRQHTEFRFVGI